MAMRCPKCDTPLDPFEMETWRLNSIMREVADALASQVADNPGASRELQQAAKQLQYSPEDFTDALYRGIE